MNSSLKLTVTLLLAFFAFNMFCDDVAGNFSADRKQNKFGNGHCSSESLHNSGACVRMH